MLVYNITVGVDKAIEQEWLSWMKATHIPKVMQSGFFETTRFYKIITHDDPETVSYAIQYFVTTIGQLQRYLDDVAPALHEEVKAKFGMRQVEYRTLLEEC